MAKLTLEERAAVLEAEVTRLKHEKNGVSIIDKPWWEQIRGTFKDDLGYVEAMRLGRKYRVSLRPSDAAA